MANAKEIRRFQRLSEMGCQACKKHTGAFVQGEICHHTDGGRRVGHGSVFTLCPYHHRGSITPGMTGDEMERAYGPSFAKGKKQFVATFGSERQLVLEANAWLGAP